MNTSLVKYTGDVFYYCDFLNQLIKVTKNGTIMSEYGYDPTGLRVVKKANNATTHYVFEGTEPIFEKNLTTNKIKSYIYAFGKHLARVDGVIGDTTAAKYYYHTDQLGSVKVVTDSSGAVVHQADYYAFGTQFDKSGSFDEDHGFNGKEYDEDIGLYYYNARWYDSELGRFISEDPAMDPNNPNLYSYCGNNPTGRIDADGQFWHILAKFVISAVVHWVYNAASDAAQQDGSFWYNFTHNLWHNPRTSVSGYVDSQGKVQCGERPETVINYDFDKDYNVYSTQEYESDYTSSINSIYQDFAEQGWFEDSSEFYIDPIDMEILAEIMNNSEYRFASNGYIASSNIRMGAFCVSHPIAASMIGIYQRGSINISTRATRFAAGLGLYENDEHQGSEVNALRHCIWQAYIANKFGLDIAFEVGNAHEDNPFVDLSISKYRKLIQADQTIDLRNNIIGRGLGIIIGRNATMKEITSVALDYFHENGLWEANRSFDNMYVVTLTRISDEKYENAKNILSNMDENGRIKRPKIPLK